MSLTDYAAGYFEQIHKALDALDIKSIEAFARVLTNTRMVFVCGNGGSAALASHMAVDLGKVSGRDIPVIALTDTAWITAVANDNCYAEVFVSQLERLARPGDVLVAISTSGRSLNVLCAVEWAKANRLTVVALTNSESNALARMADVVIAVPSTHTGICEDVHSVIMHTLAWGWRDGCGT